MLVVLAVEDAPDRPSLLFLTSHMAMQHSIISHNQVATECRMMNVTRSRSRIRGYHRCRLTPI